MVSERTKAILLFTSYLSKDSDKVNKPLSLTEWNKLVKWLQHKEIFPEVFLSEASTDLLNSWNDQSISRNRLAGLLERKTALALALDKWTRAGVWVISRGDQSYPKTLKEKLKGAAPNILFGIGDQQLLNLNYIGVVGSRNAADQELNLTKGIGRRACSQSYGIVSGGAKGVDETAMLGALESGGNCVGFLADSLIKKSTSSVFRNYIIKNKLVLATPFNPEAGFNAGNAMSRNKLIYALADAAIIVISDVKGGTWEGAKENLKNNWTPLWVCPSTEKGNKEIIKIGGQLLAEPLAFDIKQLNRLIGLDKPETNLFSEPEDQIKSARPIAKTISINAMTNFDFFVFKWYEFYQFDHVNKEILAEKLELTLSQVDSWLEKAAKLRLAAKQEDTNDSWFLSTEIKIE